MRKLLLAAAAGAALVAATPASAQVYLGADARGAGVQVGPFGVGVGPRYNRGYRNGYYAYGAHRRMDRGYRPYAYGRSHRGGDRDPFINDYLHFDPSGSHE